MRSITALVCSGLLVGAAICAVPRVSEARPPAVQIKKLSIRPTAFSASGGSIFVKVAVTARGAAINSVRAQAQFPGRGGPTATLTQQGSVYSGRVSVTPNFNTTAARGSLVVFVVTPQRTIQRVVAKIKMAPGDDSLPPPPPRS